MDRYWSRAKDKITKEWLFGFFMVGINPSTSKTEAFINVIKDDGTYGMTIGVDPDTVGGYVMEDVNRRPIFGGDIVRAGIGESGVTGVVERDSQYPQYHVRVISKYNDATIGLRTKVEVIGNIYDNPELLEVKK